MIKLTSETLIYLLVFRWKRVFWIQLWSLLHYIMFQCVWVSINQQHFSRGQFWLDPCQTDVTTTVCTESKAMPVSVLFFWLGFFFFFSKIQEKRSAAWLLGGKHRTIPWLCNLFCTFTQVYCVTCQVTKQWDSPQTVCFSLYFCILTVKPFILIMYEPQGAQTRYFCLCSSNPCFTFNLTRPAFSSVKLSIQNKVTLT